VFIDQKRANFIKLKQMVLAKKAQLKAKISK